MMQKAKWIWLDTALYPQLQQCPISCANHAKSSAYGMAEFHKIYHWEKDAVSAEIRVSGDTRFRLYCDGKLVGIGPVAAGGDFGHDIAMPRHFENNYHIALEGNRTEIFVQVQLSPTVLCDWSQGHGGFFLEGEVLLEDGSRKPVFTEESWDARQNAQYPAPYQYDARIQPDPWGKAVETPCIWNLSKPEIPMLKQEVIFPLGAREYVVAAGEEREIAVEFDRIYAGFVLLETESSGICEIEVRCRETTGADAYPEHLYLVGNMHYRGFEMHSIGALDIRIKNEGDLPAIIRPALSFCSYPLEREGCFVCSDPELEKIWEVCKWTLRICRQTLHLDSPRHQEPLACTGDYYIESLMTAYTFGDMRLARLDIIRTADRLFRMDGWMFHTTYSLIWVRMLWDVYQLNGDKEMVRYCLPALRALMKRFHSYADASGILTGAPNYMFIDWMVADGYSMHHPPKALGQTALNAFYYDALRIAVKLLETADDTDYNAFIPIYTQRADSLYAAFHERFYDEEKQLFFDGEGTPEPAAKWRPANVNHRYFSKHSNILAVMAGLCEPAEGRRILENVLERQDLLDMQPYFMHFALEAVWKTGLFSLYGLQMLRRWVPMVEACSKGLQEGWYKPEEGYAFDYSHAWGGTPAYQLPARLLGLEMLEPGFRKVRLVPRLYGLKWAEIRLPTPLGMLACRMEDGKDPVVWIPDGMEAEIC